jgi:hypothetical protein
LKEHQTGHWKQHKKVCKAADAMSVRCRQLARFLAEEPVEDWQAYLHGVVSEFDEMTLKSGPRASQHAMCETLIALGVCETLVARCSSPWGDGLVELVGFLRFLASVEDGAKRLAAAPSFELLAELFRDHTGDENAVYVGCSLMGRLALRDKADDQLMCGGLVEGVVAAIRAHSTSVKVVDVGVAAISFLAGSADPDVCLRLVNAGAVEVVKGALLCSRDCLTQLGVYKTLEVLLGQHGHSDEADSDDDEYHEIDSGAAAGL